MFIHSSRNLCFNKRSTSVQFAVFTLLGQNDMFRGWVMSSTRQPLFNHELQRPLQWSSSWYDTSIATFTFVLLAFIFFFGHTRFIVMIPLQFMKFRGKCLDVLNFPISQNGKFSHITIEIVVVFRRQYFRAPSKFFFIMPNILFAVR